MCLGNLTSSELRSPWILIPRPLPAWNPNRNIPGSVSGGGGPYLLGEGRGWQLPTFVLHAGHFRCPSRDSPIAMLCQEEASGDETCAVHVDENAEHSSEPSLVSTEM